MRLMLRIVSTIFFFGGIAALGTVFLTHVHLVVGVSIIIGLWKIIRDSYLSRWQIEINGNSVTVIRKMHVRNSVCYSEICRVQILWPSIRILILHLTQRPESERVIGDTLSRLAVPVGTEWSHALRRLWTLSEDLLIQTCSGVTIMIPLGTLDSSERRELWTQLRLKAPPSIFRPDPSLLERATMEEGNGDKLRLDRQWNGACQHYQDAANLWEKAAHMDSKARCFRHIVDCHLQLGRYTEAAGVASQALNLASNLVDRYGKAYSLNHLAAIEWKIAGQEGLCRALKYIEDAEKLYADLKMPFYKCRMMSNQAIIREQLFVLTGESTHLNKCKSLAEEALDIIRTELHGDQSVNTRMQEANLLGSLARYKFYREDWKDASSLFEEAFNIGQSVGRYMIIDDLAMWGRALFKLSQNDSTSKSDTNRLQLLHHALKKLDNAVRAAQGNGGFSELIEVYSLRADTFWDMGNMEAAAKDYEMVISLLESSRFMLERPLDRISLLRRYRKVYPRTVEALLSMADRDSEHAYDLIERAFQHCERGKARDLAEFLSLSTMSLSKMPLSHEFEVAKQSLRAAHLHIETLQKKEQESYSQDLLQAWEQLKEAQDIYKQIVESSPEFAELISPKVPSLSEIQSWLPNDNSGAVIEFKVGENALCVFFITREVEPVKTCFMINTLGRKELEKRFPCNETQERWENLLPNLIEMIENEILAAPGSHGIRIRKLLDIPKLKRLVIVPDGILHRLPIHAAIKDGIEVTYAPSSTVLIHTITQFRETPNKVLIVNPGHFPEAEYEVKLIEARLKKGGISVSKIEGKDATSDATIECMRTHSWCHFACHGKSNFQSPLESYLVMADRNLTAKEIMAEGVLQSGAWVVLDACESGISPPDPSGEYIGLPAAFLTAGATIVISTLWMAHLGTPLVMIDRFYENIVEKELSVPVSLREACNYLHSLTLSGIKKIEGSKGMPLGTLLSREERDYFPPDHPFHWAPFIVCGAGWSANEVPVDAMKIGSHQKELPKLPINIGVGLPPQLNEMLKEADRLLTQKQSERAVSVLEEAPREWRQSRPLNEKLADAYADLKNFQKARQHHREVLRYDQNSPLSHYNLGCVYRDFACITEAKECFQQALRLNPAYANALINLAELTNDPQEALEYLNKALRIEPEDKDAQNAMRMWQELSDEDRASIALQRLMWAQQDIDKGNFLYARLHLALVRQETIDDIAKALAFRIESDILRKEGDIKGSITALESAVELDLNQPAYWNTLAARRVLLISNPELLDSERLSMLRKAKLESLKAISLNDYARPHQNLALIYLNLARLDKAREHAILAREMAQQQIDAGQTGKIICKGCSTEGKILTECQECLRKALGTLRDIELASGNYRVE